MTLVVWWQTISELIPHISLFIWIIWLLYLLILGAWIILQKREPVATLSWLLTLALLPIVGFLIYHFLGPTRIKRKNLRRMHAKSNLMPLLQSNNSYNASALMKLSAGSSGFSPSSASEIELLINGTNTFAALVQAFAEAKQHIHLEYYIFEPDQTGTRIREALIAAAKRGVQVRLLMDRLGSKNINEKFLRPLREAGVSIAFFHEFLFKHIWRPQNNIRSHRKIVVVDGMTGFTGGINVTDDENESIKSDAYVDLHLRIRGDVVRWLQLAFVQDWIYAGGAFNADAGYWPEPVPGDISAQVLAAGPDTPWEPIHRAQVFAINNAKKKVVLATPYFVPSDAALMALSSAALRGLDVILIVPKKSDSKMTTLAARSYFEDLDKAGMRIFEYPHMLHTKALLIDDDTIIVGSSNFDYRSFRLNFELSLLIEHKATADVMARILFEYIHLSKQVDGNAKTPFGERLKQAFARLFSPLL